VADLESDRAMVNSFGMSMMSNPGGLQRLGFNLRPANDHADGDAPLARGDAEDGEGGGGGGDGGGGGGGGFEDGEL
jgi:hypothetical protein